MPIYEFISPEKNRIYSFFSHSVITPELAPKCPDDPGLRLKRMVSGFAVVGRAKEKEDGPDPDDPRMDAVMAEMEREMARIDEENPDPRQMGQLMRRMSEVSGEKLPDVMEEMVGRLEAGEDPEKLEQEYGDLSELDTFASGDAGSDADEKPGLRHRILRRRRGPDRDPQLYALRDYI